jgi:hypothetical protein
MGIPWLRPTHIPLRHTKALESPVIIPTLIALASLAFGVAFYFHAVHSERRNQHSSFLISWLLIALTPVFLVFTFFPSSSISGSVQGFTFGGAVAAFVFVWVYGSRRSVPLSSLDRLQEALDLERSKGEELEAQLSRLTATEGPTVLADQQVFAYGIASRRDRQVLLVTGDILNVHFADLWVNSENSNMQMSRFFERTISAAIRYHGAKKDELGSVQEDTIANELAQKMGAATSVAPGTVLVTSPGQLASTHGVKAILHVAAVTGVPGTRE